MIFYDKRGCRVSGEELGETEGHWIVSFVGSKAEVAEVYDYVLTTKEEFYGEDYPDFVRDFEESKQFFVEKQGEWTPCKWEECQDDDQVLLRANSLTPCDIERMEDNDFFFNLVDDTDSSSRIHEAYCIWPLNPKLQGYLCYLAPRENSGNWFRLEYSVEVGPDRKIEDRMGWLLTKIGDDEYIYEGVIEPFPIAYTEDIDDIILEQLGME